MFRWTGITTLLNTQRPEPRHTLRRCSAGQARTVTSTPLLKSAPKREFWKGPFCKVDAGARLFRHKKMGILRPRARLGASTAIIKKNGTGHRDADEGGFHGHFLTNKRQIKRQIKTTVASTANPARQIRRHLVRPHRLTPRPVPRARRVLVPVECSCPSSARARRVLVPVECSCPSSARAR